MRLFALAGGLHNCLAVCFNRKAPARYYYMIYGIFCVFAWALGCPVVACTLLDEFSDFSSDCMPASDGAEKEV